MSTEDFEITTQQGRIVGRVWRPAVGANRAPIVLFHDSLGSVGLWRTFPAALSNATGREVVAYDRLGFGRSDAHPSHLLADFIQAEAHCALPQLLQRLGTEQFVACGHSVGGGMAACAAVAFPETCSALVTIAAQAFNEEKTKAGIRASKIAFADPENFARLERHHGTKTRWVLDAWTETWLSPGFAEWSLDDTLTRVRCPVLALHGADDEYGSTSHAERIAAGRGRFHVLPGVGHVPHREAEGLTVDLIAAFLGSGDRANNVLSSIG